MANGRLEYLTIYTAYFIVITIADDVIFNILPLLYKRWIYRFRPILQRLKLFSPIP